MIRFERETRENKVLFYIPAILKRHVKSREIITMVDMLREIVIIIVIMILK